MTREEVLTEILDKLTFIKTRIRASNRQNEGSINVHSEDLLVRLLNKVYGWKLGNLNYIEGTNVAGVDLGDKTNKIAVQITATSTIGKVRHTLEQFKKNKLHEQYNELYVVLTSDRETSTKYENAKDNLQKIVGNRIQFDPFKHVLDFNDIYEDIKAKYEIEFLKEINELLSEELALFQFAKHKVYVAFDKEDKNFDSVLETCKRLLEKNIVIYHSSTILDLKLRSFKHYHKANYVHSAYAELEIDSAIIIDPELKERSDKFKNDAFLKEITKDNGSVFIISRGKLKWEAKRTFNTNQIQTIPFDKDYIFINNLVTLLEKQSQVEQIQDNQDIQLVLEMANSNANVVLINEEIDLKKRIGYKLFANNDRFTNAIQSYFIYFHKNAGQKATATRLQELYSELKEQKAQIIVITPERLTDKISQNIKKAFNAKVVFNEKDFIWDYCTPNDFTQTEPVNYLKGEKQFYISPIIKNLNNKEQVDLEYIEQWLHQNNSPTLFISGEGGIGKTTLTHYLADLFLEQSTKSKVIFIDSRNIKNELIRLKDQSATLDLYSFYEINCKQNGNNSYLSQEQFRINLDQGNILIIIDGLDEIISQVTDFNANDFLENVRQYNSNINNAKILITCRSYFVKNKHIKYDHTIEVIKLSPFTKKMMEDYFKKKFEHHTDSERKYRKALEIANQLRLQREHKEDKYIPFVLVLIFDLIKSNVEQQEEQLTDISSKYLRTTQQSRRSYNDYVIYRLCTREMVRMGQINVDAQIKVLMEIAVLEENIVNEIYLKRIFDNTFEQMSTSHIEGFKTHVLLAYDEERKAFNFKFDFLRNLFKSIYLSELIKNDTLEHIPNSILEIIENECLYNSAFVKQVAERLSTIDKDKVNWFNLLVATIKESDYNTLLQKTTPPVNLKLREYKFKSGLLMLALRVFQADNIDKRTKLLKDIFNGKPNTLDGISIINVHSRKKLRFNFENQTIVNSYFESYDAFWFNKMNENTIFEQCTFIDIHNNTKQTLKESNFVNCYKDDEFTQSFNEAQQSEQSSKRQIENYLKTLFSFFYQNGRFNSIYLNRTTKGSSLEQKHNALKLFSMNEMVEFMTTNNVLELSENKERIHITKGFIQNAENLCNQGFPTIEMKKLIAQLQALKNK